MVKLSVFLSPSGKLCVELPGKRSHTVELAPGFAEAMLVHLLNERAQAPAAKLNEKAAPSQALLDAYASALARGAKAQRAEFKPESILDFVDL
jgi:hypothetical protein